MSDAEDDDPSDDAERREIRSTALCAMTSAQLRDEIDRQASCDWRSPGRLRTHVQDHQRDFLLAYGRHLGVSEVASLVRAILANPDLLYTELTTLGIEWHFMRTLDAESAMIIVVRGDYVRSIYRTASLSRWLARHAAAIEVMIP